MPLSQLMKKVSLSAINSSNRINISFPIYSTQLYATNCWSCKRLFDEKQSKGLLCPCSKAIIQPVNSKINYFELFNFPIEYKINQIELTRSFRNLMKLLHPDKFSNKSEVSIDACDYSIFFSSSPLIYLYSNRPRNNTQEINLRL